jgi:hypothetical protein
MSCSDPNKNNDAKKATYDTLNNIYKFTDNDKFKPISIEILFQSEPDKSIYENINTNLDNLDNLDNSENKKDLFIKDYLTSNIYQNCAIQANNPWFTTSSDYKKCEIIKDIILDDKLKYSADKTVINLNLKSKNKSKTAYCPYYKNINKAYCENRWYDWIVTPNYYLGNTYFKDNSKFGENDVYKCFKPCDGDTIPYRTNKGENKCIPKKYFGNGIFANKLMFSPIGLINLIGHVAIMSDDITNSENKNLLYKLYKLILNYNILNKMDDTIYKTNDVYKDIDNKLFNDFELIYEEFKTSINDNILKGDNFNTNDKQEYKYINDLTYKNRNFNEDESEMYTLKGLDTCGALIPPILHHTWILANIFKPLEEDYIEKFTIAYKKNKLYDKLYSVFNDDKNKAQRLTNIFFKAVNVCYNNKSNFSINIIDKTKKTFETYKDNYKTILGLYNFTEDDITNTYSSDNPIFNNEYRYYLDYELTKIKIDFTTVAGTDATKIEELNKIKGYLNGYFYAQEALEAQTCGKGEAFNSKIGECEAIIEEPIIDKNAPVEDEMDAFNIPEIKNILYMFLQIILVIVILYIIYIFYDIFGETIFTVYNYIYMKIYYEMSTNIYSSFMSIFNTEEEEYVQLKAETEYKLVNKQYENLKQNSLKVSSYINEHNIHKNANV